MPLKHPYIRPFDSSTDFPSAESVHTTIDPALRHEPARFISTQIFFNAYLRMEGQLSFVLDRGDRSGQVVGYIIGTHDTVDFSKRWLKEFTPRLPQQFVPLPGFDTGSPHYETSLVRGLRTGAHEGICSSLLYEPPKMLAKFPAHFQIAILPEYQRVGWDKILVGHFLDALVDMDVAGVHVGVDLSTDSAEKYYAKLGFMGINETLRVFMGINGTLREHSIVMAIMLRD